MEMESFGICNEIAVHDLVYRGLCRNEVMHGNDLQDCVIYDVQGIQRSLLKTLDIKSDHKPTRENVELACDEPIATAVDMTTPSNLDV